MSLDQIGTSDLAGKVYDSITQELLLSDGCRVYLSWFGSFSLSSGKMFDTFLEPCLNGGAEKKVLLCVCQR